MSLVDFWNGMERIKIAQNGCFIFMRGNSKKERKSNKWFKYLYKKGWLISHAHLIKYERIRIIMISHSKSSKMSDLHFINHPGKCQPFDSFFWFMVICLSLDLKTNRIKNTFPRLKYPRSKFRWINWIINQHALLIWYIYINW